jgi:cation transporter-like permease
VIDAEQKGCFNYEYIKTFLMVNGLVDGEILQAIKKFLSRVDILVMFPATLKSLL